MRTDLPSGTVTFVFTDVEGSTRLLHELGAEAYAEALAQHRRVLRDSFTHHGGVEVDTQGDAFFYAFPTATGALEAARAGQEALASGPIRVRIGIHTGKPHLTKEGYVGDDVHKGARIAAAGHGGQVLLSKETSAPDDMDVLDLGEHRLKDFPEPVWILQLGSESFPPLKTISNTNLPRPASSFVGRESELKDVLLLLQDGARLLTLSGPGGSGKTRLAIEVATELVPEFRNGVFWVGLAAVRDPALVGEEIAQALGAKDGLADFVAERELLLLLDNFEQIVDAAPDLSMLLSASADLRVIVTSRELLRIQGEVEYAVPPLARSEAVELFCTRSRLQPDVTIAELCRRVDDLPLAVELAAARTSVLTPAQILARLSTRLDLLKGGRDADPRQATLRATIEWSFDLLPEDEKNLFARLAVFSGGHTLESAEEVAGAELDILQSLVDKSLVRHVQDRFWMLETIREYAAERLEDSGEAEKLQRRHAEHFLALAEEAEPHLFQYSKEWLDRVEGELDNLRAAFDRLRAHDESQLALRLVGAVAEFWGIRGHLAEGRRRFESALAADHSPTKARAKALNGAADVALGSGDNETARARAEEALRIHRMLGDAWGTADSLFLLGVAHANEDGFETAQEHLVESARIFGELGDQHQAMLTARILAWTYEELGDRERARVQHQDNLRRARTAGIKDIEGHSLEGLAQIAMSEGRPDVALPMLDEAYRITRDLDDLYRTPIILSRYAHALALLGKAKTAARILSCSEALQKEIGSRTRWVTKMDEDTLSTIRAQLDETAIAEAWEQGRTLTADQAIALDSLDR